MSIQAGEHTTKAFDADLQALSQLVGEMGGRVERQIDDAIDALVRHDPRAAQRVITADETVDDLQRRIEERAVTTIATRQPMALDLREVISIFRIASELERVGDLAKNIAKRVITLNGADMPFKALRGVTHITVLAHQQLHDVLDSFARRDADMAAVIRAKDQDIDAMYTSLFRELLTYMIEDPQMITFGIHLLFCAKNIERIGDHATNIAEAVYYMVEGQPLRERSKADLTTNITLSVAH